MRIPARFLLAPLLLACAGAVAAGTVNVTFVNASSYTDAGNTAWDEEANMKELARHLRALGTRLLPADHVLDVEVLDIDLAGTTRPGRSIRIVNGGVDFPRIELRYTLQAPGQPARSAQERIVDMNYLLGLAPSPAAPSLIYEKRMLSRWFRERFSPG